MKLLASLSGGLLFSTVVIKAGELFLPITCSGAIQSITDPCAMLGCTALTSACAIVIFQWEKRGQLVHVEAAKHDPSLQSPEDAPELFDTIQNNASLLAKVLNAKGGDCLGRVCSYLEPKDMVAFIKTSHLGYDIGKAIFPLEKARELHMLKNRLQKESYTVTKEDKVLLTESVGKESLIATVRQVGKQLMHREWCQDEGATDFLSRLPITSSELGQSILRFSVPCSFIPYYFDGMRQDQYVSTMSNLVPFVQDWNQARGIFCEDTDVSSARFCYLKTNVDAPDWMAGASPKSKAVQPLILAFRAMLSQLHEKAVSEDVPVILDGLGTWSQEIRPVRDEAEFNYFVDGESQLTLEHEQRAARWCLELYREELEDPGVLWAQHAGYIRFGALQKGCLDFFTSPLEPDLLT